MRVDVDKCLVHLWDGNKLLLRNDSPQAVAVVEERYPNYSYGRHNMLMDGHVGGYFAKTSGGVGERDVVVHVIVPGGYGRLEGQGKILSCTPVVWKPMDKDDGDEKHELLNIFIKAWQGLCWLADEMDGKEIT